MMRSLERPQRAGDIVSHHTLHRMRQPILPHIPARSDRWASFFCLVSVFVLSLPLPLLGSILLHLSPSLSLSVCESVSRSTCLFTYLSGWLPESVQVCPHCLNNGESLLLAWVRQAPVPFLFPVVAVKAQHNLTMSS